MSIDNILCQAVAKALGALYGLETEASSISLQATRREFRGSHTLVVFPWVKAARKSPEAVAEEIGKWLKENEPAVADYNVVKGFLNIEVDPKVWNSVLAAIVSDDNFGITEAGPDSPLVMVEYSSPNTNKPLHLSLIHI